MGRPRTSSPRLRGVPSVPLSDEPDFLHEIDFRRYRLPLLLSPAVAAVVAWPEWVWTSMPSESIGWLGGWAALLLGVGLCGLVVAALTGSALWLLAVPVVDIARLVSVHSSLDWGEDGYVVHLGDGTLSPLSVSFVCGGGVCPNLFAAFWRLRANAPVASRSCR